MESATALASVGDRGVLNVSLSQTLSEVWIDQDLSWLDFNERVLAEAIGRFLEHSRVFHFANGKANPVDGDFFIGSADWMFRNLSKRIEVVTPVFASGLKQRLWECLDIGLRDRRQAWILNADASWSQLQPDGNPDSPEAIGTHQVLMNLTRHRAD